MATSHCKPLFVVSQYSSWQVSILNSDYIKTAVLKIHLQGQMFYIKECNIKRLALLVKTTNKSYCFTDILQTAQKLTVQNRNGHVVLWHPIVCVFNLYKCTTGR